MFNSVGVAEEQIYGDLYLSWLRDAHEQTSAESMQLFRDMVESGFRDRQIVLRRQRLGVNVVTSLSTMLHRAPLTKLDLHGNALRDVGCDVLSRMMRDLPQLAYLDIGANDIRGSGMQSLSAVVAQHPKLSTLILGSPREDPYANRLTPAGTALLLEGCLRSRTLRVLDLSGSEFGRPARRMGGHDLGESDDEEDELATEAALGAAATATMGDSRPATSTGEAPVLSHGARGHAGRPAHLLEQLVRTSTTLTTLRLRDVRLSNRGALALIAALHKNTVLSTLDMSYNRLSMRVSYALGHLLQERAAMRVQTALAALHVNGNDLFGSRARLQCNDFGVSKKFAAQQTDVPTHTAAATKMNATCQSLQSAGEGGDDEDNTFGHFFSQPWRPTDTPSASGVVAAMAAEGSPYLFLAALAHDRGLKVLEMDACGVDDNALTVFCRALATNSALEVLSMRDNSIGVDGAVSLGRALCQHTTLQKLYLGGNVLEDEGVCALAAMLEKDETIQVLDVQRTWLADRGLIALGVALQTNKALRVLSLSDNHFTHEGAEAFAAFLEKNEHIVSCRLGATSAPHHTRLRIERASAKNMKRAENAEPDALVREVVRLHFQHYKLNEARIELEALRDKSAELKRSSENFELQFKQDQSDYLKRKRELEEQMENDVSQEQRYGEQSDKLMSDLQKARAQHEDDMDVTAQRLKQETLLRETVEATFNEVEAELNDWKNNRASREAKLESTLKDIKMDMVHWSTQRKEYKEQAEALQIAVAALEKHSAAKGIATATASGAEGGKKRASSVKKKKSTAA